jgi:hypothetical protein
LIINHLSDGPRLAACVGMRTLALLLAFLFMPIPSPAQEIEAPEGTIIRSAEVSGLPFEGLGLVLRQDIRALAGDPLNRERLGQLAARIEAERPDVVVAIRGIPAPDNEVRIVFLVARIGDDPSLEANINARYTIEGVGIEGIPESRVSQQLRNDLQALVGTRLDNDEAVRLERQLASDLPGYDVRRRIARGSRRGRIRLVFDVSRGEATRWIRFAPTRSKLLYHSDQGWSGFLDLPIGGRDHRVALVFPLDNADDLIEEYSGYGVRVESRRVASERLGVSVELAKSRQTWQPSTLSALASDLEIPEAYRTRSTVAPSITFAFTPRVRATAGVSVSELESLSRSPESRMASALVGAIGYDQRWEASGASHDVEASFAWRSAATALESDLEYTRYLLNGRYRYDGGNSSLSASASVGYISGRAPLFERFSLGDSSTLRGWNKYDVAPAGGERMFHASIEYRNRGLALFLETGSVWDRGEDARVRVATGFGFHLDNVFLTLGLPVNTSDLRPVFTMGVRF